ncbi:MAG: universal stress protein [Desulfobacula sp.]|jgi:nucleotide-binding universal stress UspA family protein|uniref:universal stress protein n=1 Tax=Desulfobacula sp. TaxID=2593537 RepID=UPI001E197775|nr:universal stress protein [Desulfobacula sp.]MBT3486871.1 universal stress protein [Desulfobacula sp.]MBT3806239.1 universal stress protein [Desulfobacula sp.]MBT4025292.1 universal stress protein [Desulfobacula sp.]MBT4199379.1 universal stress protein [Desulfobacula sp.]
MSREINKILACVDFSDYSLMVLEYSIALARQSNNQIIVLNVINQREISDSETPFGIFPNYVSKGTSLENYVGKLKKERTERLKHLIKENFFNDKSLMSIIIDSGSPFECILKTIEAENIDVVVIADRGRGNLSKVLFGSTAEKIFRHSPVPVFSVRERKMPNLDVA